MRSQTGRLIEAYSGALRLSPETGSRAGAHREPLPVLAAGHHHRGEDPVVRPGEAGRDDVAVDLGRPTAPRRWARRRSRAGGCAPVVHAEPLRALGDRVERLGSGGRSGPARAASCYGSSTPTRPGRSPSDQASWVISWSTPAWSSPDMSRLTSHRPFAAGGVVDQLGAGRAARRRRGAASRTGRRPATSPPR